MAYPAHHLHHVGGSCEACGVVGQTKHVSIMYNVGALVLRFHKTMSGQLCKRCISDYFFKYSLTTMFFGWWGVISFFTSLVALPVNLFAFLGSLGMQQPSDEAYAQAPWAAHRGMAGWKLAAIVGGVAATLAFGIAIAGAVA